MSVAGEQVTAMLERERGRVDAWLARVAAQELDASGALAEPLRYAVSGGGKRLRAVMCVLACRALGGTDEEGGGTDGVGIGDVACALELVHTYSLVHDDLPCMDDDDLRRGRPTLHRVFDPATAMAAGAALIPLAFRLLARGARALRLPPAEASALLVTLARGAGAGGMVGGQWLDLGAEHRRLALAELVRVHEAKTGALFSAALGLGARAARAGSEQVAACEAFGLQLGLAFQVIDDVLDETADTAVLGKTAGKDRQQEKATYPGLLGLDGARARAEAAVRAGCERLRTAGVVSAELEAVAQWLLDREF